MLVQLCGLPGTGKSTIAAAIADRRPAVLLRIDAIEAAMWRHGLTREQTGVAAYAVAAPALTRGLMVIAEAVSAVDAARQGWVGTAAAAGVRLCVIETVCPDGDEHRRRVTTRSSDIPGFTQPTWAEVMATAGGYEPRSDDRLVLDTRRDLDGCVAEALSYLDRMSRVPG